MGFAELGMESRLLGSLIREDTISMLHSSDWRQRLEAVVSFKEQAEVLEFDMYVETLIRFIFSVPGRSEKNVQVQQQVIDVITHFASKASNLPRACVQSCLKGIAERVADIDTRAQAMKCLTCFCEAVGLRFVFEKLCDIMKTHKNPEVLSECILWMVTAVDDFGVSSLELEALIVFFKGIDMQSNAAATRNAIKLLGTSHKFVGPDIKTYLGGETPVLPALHNAILAECEKNPFEGASAVTKRTVKTSDPISGGLDSLPREDISKITPTLLRLNDFEGGDWMGALTDILKCLGDEQKHIRECTLRTLNSWVKDVHLHKMMPYITAALMDSSF